MSSDSSPSGLRRAEQALELLARLVDPAAGGQRVHVPEGADREGGVWAPEVVLVSVAIQQVAVAQFLADALERRQEARIGGRQQARVPAAAGRWRRGRVPPKVDAKQPALLVPGARQDTRAACAGPSPPAPGRGSIAQTRARCAPAGRSRPRTSRPRTCGRCCEPRSSHGPASGNSKTALARSPSRSSRVEQRLVAGAHQPLVEEQLRGGEDHRAVDVVLHSVRRRDCRRAPAPCRGSPAAARCFSSALRIAADAVQRLQFADGGARRDVVDEVQVGFHRARRAEAVQRLDHEVAVAQPAIAIVPVARRIRRLRNRRGQRGQHRAGVLVGAELQRDRGADHRVLPVERNGQRAHPVLPVAAGLGEEFAGASAGGDSSTSRPDRARRSAVVPAPSGALRGARTASSRS